MCGSNFAELRQQLRAMLMRGENIAYVSYDDEQRQLLMYGFARVGHNKLVVANKIFEMLLYVFFVDESKRYNRLKQEAAASRAIFVAGDGGLDVPKIMEHFILEHNRIHSEATQRFLEEKGRERFLTYLSPIAPITQLDGQCQRGPEVHVQRVVDGPLHHLRRRHPPEGVQRVEREVRERHVHLAEAVHDPCPLAFAVAVELRLAKDRAHAHHLERLQGAQPIGDAAVEVALAGDDVALPPGTAAVSMTASFFFFDSGSMLRHGRYSRRGARPGNPRAGRLLRWERLPRYS